MFHQTWISGDLFSVFFAPVSQTVHHWGTMALCVEMTASLRLEELRCHGYNHKYLVKVRKRLWSCFLKKLKNKHPYGLTVLNGQQAAVSCAEVQWCWPIHPVWLHPSLFGLWRSIIRHSMASSFLYVSYRWQRAWSLVSVNVLTDAVIQPVLYVRTQNVIRCLYLIRPVCWWVEIKLNYGLQLPNSPLHPPLSAENYKLKISLIRKLCSAKSVESNENVTPSGLPSPFLTTDIFIYPCRPSGPHQLVLCDDVV